MTKWANVYPALTADAEVTVSEIIMTNPYPDPDDDSTWLYPANMFIECHDDVDTSGNWLYSKNDGFYLKPSPTPDEIKKQLIKALQSQYLPMFRENNIVVGAAVFEAKEDLSDLPAKLKELREDDHALYIEYKDKLDQIIKGETVDVSCARPKRCVLCGQYTLIDKGEYYECSNCGNIEYK